MSQPTETFQEISERCVRNFLHTVVIIDDQAFRTNNSRSPEALDTPGLLMQGPAHQNDAPVVEQQEAVVRHGVGMPGLPHMDENKTASPEPFDLDAEEVVRLFARTGVVCAVLEPQDSSRSSELLTDSMPAAKRADALILDWRIHDTDGDHALSLIKGVLTDDGSHNGRLRLILIYTAEPDLNTVYTRLHDALAKDKIVITPDRENLVLSNAALRITVLAKPTTLLRAEWQKHAVNLAGLPMRLITEFSRLTSGLVSNVALSSLAILRNQTHTLLAQMGREMDSAFLTHRTLLPNPNDSIDHITEFVAGEISALLQSYEVGSISNVVAVEAWVNQNATYTLQGKTITAEQVIQLVRDGRAAPTWAGEDGSKKFKQQFGVARKNLHTYLTSMLASPDASSQDIDHRFTIFTSMVRRYESTQPAPWLRLGAILQHCAHPTKYFICVQPSCHCVRLGQQQRAFLFAPSTEQDSVGLGQVVKDNNSFRKLKFSLRSYDIEKVTFAPTGQEEIVRAKQEAEAYFFTSSDATKYRWVGQLKDMYAQRVANRLGSAIAEVALNEYEWDRTPTP